MEMFYYFIKFYIPRKKGDANIGILVTAHRKILEKEKRGKFICQKNWS